MRNRSCLYLYDSPIGRIIIIENGSAITDLYFSDSAGAGGTFEKTALLEEAAVQLNEYFAGERRVFDLPVELKGTAFQLRVWQALQNIPYGQTRSYGQIARVLGNEKACRAVGMANNRNPVSIIIPCHRVIGFNGKLVGYGGGLDKKAYLLELEKNNASKLRITEK